MSSLWNIVYMFLGYRENDIMSEKVSAKVNKLFDAMLPSIHKFILKQGLDPMKLQDVSEKLVFMPSTWPKSFKIEHRSFFYSYYSQD